LLVTRGTNGGYAHLALGAAEIAVGDTVSKQLRALYEDYLVPSYR
jgi:hypothetical protein